MDNSEQVRQDGKSGCVAALVPELASLLRRVRCLCAGLQILPVLRRGLENEGGLSRGLKHVLEPQIVGDGLEAAPLQLVREGESP